MPLIHVPCRDDARVDAPQHLGFFRVGFEVHDGVADALRVHGKDLAAHPVHRVLGPEWLIARRQRHGEREAVNGMFEVRVRQKFGGGVCAHSFESSTRVVLRIACNLKLSYPQPNPR